ncbi:Uncharacterized protein TCM_037084 [Theobroma cacao]|uniref:Factor of DNA methylation 1-5/IDN2 domain-containing protein n=1 Tax=Theobroma cacao TaxID=3641 RepID=A0A061GI84_THECC|nr:Uncharacterized protein TCM_037084 [Theobroma cacao]
MCWSPWEVVMVRDRNAEMRRDMEEESKEKAEALEDSGIFANLKPDFLHYRGWMGIRLIILQLSESRRWKKPFQNAFKKRYPMNEAPGGGCQEALDENDEKEELNEDWVDEVYKAVVPAFKELNECNPSCRYPLREF